MNPNPQLFPLNFTRIDALENSPPYQGGLGGS